MKEYNEQVVETLDDAGCIIANKNIIIDNLQARIAELEEENAKLKAESRDACFGLNDYYGRKLAASQEENAHWQKATAENENKWIDACDQLAAEQLNNKRLRDALQEYIDEHEECQDADDWMAMICSVEAHHAADEALSQPSDTSALDSFVAEKVKDSESRTGNQSPCYTIARDMAVRMWEKHYKTDAPNWEPLDDFMGVLSQISNMLTGLGNVEKITQQRDLAVEALEWAADVLPPSDPGGIGGCDCPVCRALETIKESDGK